MSDDPPRPRPPHVITSAEVGAWLADSVVKTVTYHRTSTADARAIVERGVRIERSRIGSYGQGFYTATEADEFYGEVEIALAVRLQSPLIGSDDEVSTVVSRLVRRFDPVHARLSPAAAQAVRRALLQAGYDGIVVYDGGGDGIDFVVALLDGAARVVIDE